jgi:hypothetical protein
LENRTPIEAWNETFVASATETLEKGFRALGGPVQVAAAMMTTEARRKSSSEIHSAREKMNT